MDLATFLGFLVGTFFILVGITSPELSIENLAVFGDLRSLFIVGGGTLAALFISFPMATVLGSWRVAVKAFLHRPRDPVELIRQLVEFAELARREGILELERAIEDNPDPFLTKSILLAVDGTDPLVIEGILEEELDEVADRHLVGKQVFEILARYAPAWGLIGTLIGLVLMLLHINEPAKMGEGLATALLTTFYGALGANFIFGPIANKLGKRSDEEMILKRIIVRGILAIQTGDNPRVVQEKLRTFLPPSRQNLQFVRPRETVRDRTAAEQTAAGRSGG